MQTKAGSAVEAITNTLIGFVINFSANLIVLPMFDMKVTPSKALGIGVVFTGISLIRSYVLRRHFNRMRWGNR